MCTELKNALSLNSVYFYVTNGAYITAKGPMQFDTVFANVGNAFDSTKGTFTSPTSGHYLFSFNSRCTGCWGNLRLNGEIVQNFGAATGTSDEFVSRNLVLSLNQGDKLVITNDQGSFWGCNHDKTLTYTGIFLN